MPRTPRSRRIRPLAPTRLLVLLAALAAASLGVACGDEGEPTELVLITHESFDALDEVIGPFEAEHNVDLVIQQVGDANGLVNQAILNAGNPVGDVLFGVDNLGFARAAEAGVFEEFEAERRADIPADVLEQFGDSMLVTPIDYGYVDLNFDLTAGEPPETFEDLTAEQWSGQLVVMDPATSSPGLQFLASTVAHFGEGAWQEYWSALRENDVLITDGWSDAYYTHFSHYGGDRPLVVSYTTSPAAEVFFNDLEEPPTANVIPGDLFRQVEAAGVLAGSEQPELAGEFIDYMLSDGFQRQIPETMFVYPVIEDVEKPSWWRFAEVPVTPAPLAVDPEEVERWVNEWTEIMRR